MIEDIAERRHCGRAGWSQMVSLRRVSGRVTEGGSHD